LFSFFLFPISDLSLEKGLSVSAAAPAAVVAI